MERKKSVMASIEIIKKTLKKDSDHTHFRSAKNNDENPKINIRQCSIRPNRIDRLPLPAILLTHSDEGFVLASLQGEQALILDPVHGVTQIISREELLARWSGNLILVQDSSALFSIRWFIPAFLQQKQLLCEILLFSLILQILALISPLFFQVVMDKVLVHQAWSTLDVLVFGLLITALVEVCLRGLREYQYAHTANRIDIQLGLRMVQHLFALPLLYFKSRQVGAIVTRVQELNTIREFLTGTMFTLTVDVLFMFVFLAVMASLSGMLTLVILLSIPVYVLIAWWVTPRMQQAVEQHFSHAAANTAFLNETVAGAETLKSLALEPRFVRRWDEQTCQMVTAGYRVQELNNTSQHGVMWLQKLVSACVLWLGASEVISLQLTIGQLIAFNMMASHVAQPLSRLVELWSQFIQTRIAVDKLGDMLNLPPEHQRDGVGQVSAGAIRLEQVRFRYKPDTPLIIDDLSLTIQSGETLGVVGGSGSGKSTLARLLLRLYQPEHGEIFIDGQPIRQLSLHHLRQQMGVVLQENHLFNKSIRDNIAQSMPHASLDEIIRAASLAGAHDFILRQPLGYDTVLAEGGSSLSGGQRQRIAIARTLMADPRILIFDEATSALDDESQALIQHNMRQIARGRTVIIIAHRLSTVRQCDRIIVLQRGRIVEQGDHASLLARGGHYSRLWRLQQDLHEETL
ncbi:peptidase domain-containing ABC transporter [Aeromonas veronii]|uniref:peptidase domain-containing ABC transporter n=1 Tax=Aeromonas veronii TaxID=654 RepID=UPI003F351C9E